MQLATTVDKIVFRAEDQINRRLARRIPGVAPYADLAPSSLSLVGLKAGHGEPQLNLVLPELGSQSFFAGIRTAVLFAGGLARRLNLNLRVIPIRNSPIGSSRKQTIDLLARETGLDTSKIEILSTRSLAREKISDRDFWIATHWTTAHALDIACRTGVVKRSQITYLVQDYEAGFSPWSTDYALARNTLHSGFHIVVNSRPLAQYISQEESIPIPEATVFAPSLDMPMLKKAYGARRPGSKKKILFYARPSKPRNLYGIGISALSRLSEQIGSSDDNIEFISAGEKHPTVNLGNHQIVSLGKLSWSAYYEVLSTVDIMLSLQHSPHPSHPPLDAVCSGAYAVTNEMGNTRGHLHDRLLVTRPDPDELATTTARALALTNSTRLPGFDESIVHRLGNDFEAVLDNVANDLQV